MTVYFTEAEAAEVESIAKFKNTDKAKFVVSAVRSTIDALAVPPPEMAAEKHAAIMDSTTETVKGYICTNGHVFWLDDCWPSPPLSCPACGIKSIRSTWYGTTTKGFR